MQCRILIGFFKSLDGALGYICDAINTVTNQLFSEPKTNDTFARSTLYDRVKLCSNSAVFILQKASNCMCYQHRPTSWKKWQ